MNKKIVGIFVLILSLFCFYVLVFQNPTMESMKITSTKLEEIMRTHKQAEEPLVDTLVLNGYETIYDETTDRWYYSLIENHPKRENPTVKYKSNTKDTKIAFLNSSITEDIIENNQSIQWIAYNDTEYYLYELICTTLPLININYNPKQNITKEKDIEMNFTLFDNRKDATRRVTTSNGQIHVRGATSAEFPKKGYKFSLEEQSLNYNIRKNRVSLLGMRQDEEWILYAGYNDQEKIRNVFSMNLWMDSCSKNNNFQIENGAEYRYVELFLNGEYFGLYALGTRIDSTQMQLETDKITGRKIEYIFKKNNWAASELTAAGDPSKTLVGYELRGNNQNDEEAWKKLKTFYTKLTTSTDIQELYQLTDIQNSIDIYLFYNFVQGSDNIGREGNGIKNTYITIKTKQNKDVVLYTPWDLDITFGNLWTENGKNNTIPYGEEASKNYIMGMNVITYLNKLNDLEIKNRIINRYLDLRKKAWSDERIINKLNQFEKEIFSSGAYEREKQRWKNGSYNEENIKLTKFKEYVLERLKYMDQYIVDLNNSN